MNPEAMPSPLISIITVVRNDPTGLRRTLEGIAGYKGKHTEYLLIDGASTDETLDVAKEAGCLIDRLVSEPDHGIYDAMNKGISLAKGEYLLFLNAGDELLINPEELLAVIEDEPVMVYGKAKMLHPDGSLSYIKGKRLKSRFRFLKGMPLCHQAVLYRRETIIPFDISFRIMADRVMTYQLLQRYGLNRSRFVDKVIVNYYEGGFSASLPPEVSREEENRFYVEAGVSWYRYKKGLNSLFKDYVRIPVKRLLGKN